MSLPDGAASIWCQALRISVLDVNGYVDPGASTYTTNQLIKATLTPVLATGDDIEIKNANGDLVTFAKHGDIPKYYTSSAPPTRRSNRSVAAARSCLPLSRRSALRPG